MILKKDVFTEEYDENDEDEDEDEDEENADKKGRESEEEELPFQSNAFDVDAKAKVLIYAYGRILKFQSIHLPEQIKKYMAPQYRIAEHKYSPAKLMDMK